MVDIATNNYSSRNGAKVIWVAIHTTEGIMDANDLGYYWQRITNGSSHAGCDNVKTKTYVDPAYASWTLLNGNSRSVNMEICGWARWTREEWLGPQMGRLVQAANWARQMCDRFGIPKRYIGAAGVARGEAGIIGHVDYTNGAKDGDHWDPGPGFPWDVFMQLVNGGPAGPGTGKEKEIMAGMAKGNVRPEIYMVTITPEGLFKRHIKEMAEVEFWQKQGMVVANVAQPWIDKQWDSRESVEARTKVALDQLLDDEVNIIQAVRNMPTGGQVDIPAFVSALIPVLVPALPQGVTQEQVRDALVDTLEKARFHVE